MYMDVARLFAKKIHIYHGPDVDFTIDSALSCIFKMACKAYGEYVRMVTFNKTGVQQMQIDAEWLKLTAALYLTSESSVNEVESLLCDVVTNSMERAVEYSLLEERYVYHHTTRSSHKSLCCPSVLVAIVSTKKGTMKM
ncbi:hypothetical protein DYB32_007265 [Aphanomyces invadans]|uniref:Vacuolar protein sorting-associated protein 51 homolog n=1 Tax=Aphanomyces invadans TaxID=157072 RepID=A0A418AP33_9STRA|nr:hypothetical protein DYB32_007265 [Aphanomyces invadans]